MFQIYKRFWQINWAEQWQYRANMLMYVLYWLVSPVIYLAVWTTIANSQGSVKGMTANDFITYYLTLLIVDQITSEITIHLLADKIQDGTLANELLRPVHPILTNTLVRNLAHKTLDFLVVIPVWLILVLLFRPDYGAVTPLSILAAVPTLVLGFSINFLLGATITCLAFWTTRVYSIYEFYYAMLVMFAGQFVPLPLMPAAVQNIARFLPFQLFIYIPIETILNRLPPQTVFQAYAAGLVWLAISALLFQLVWRRGVRRFSAVGA